MSIDFGQSTGINFSLSDDQKKVQLAARDFAENVLAPVVRDADREPDPLKAFQMTKPAYVEAYKRGIAVGMLPKEYGGGGLTNVELILAAEEICAVDPGFGCTVLVDGLALLPVWSWGTEEQKRRVLGAATADATGEYLAGYAASEPPGTRGGTANFDAPLPHPVGIGVTPGGTAISTSSTDASTGRATSAGGTARGRTSTSWWCAPIPTREARRGSRRSWWSGERRASPTTSSRPSGTG